MVWLPGQSVSFIKGIRFVDYAEVEVEEKEGPMGLAAG